MMGIGITEILVIALILLVPLLIIGLVVAVVLASSKRNRSD